MSSPASPSHRRALVVGLGSVDRGDDGIGPVVAGRVRDVVLASGDRCVDVVVHEDPTALADAMAGMDIAVIVDAVRSGDEPGRVTCREVGRGEPALPADTAPGTAGTHGLGLATAIELSRALDLLPARVVVVSVEAVDFEHGGPLSTPVTSAVPAAVDVILGILGIAPEGGRCADQTHLRQGCPGHAIG